MSSCSCGGKCGCGSGCKCGSGCGGCKMFPNVTENAATVKETLISGVAGTGKGSSEISENNGGCTQCGVLCDCQPCLCKKMRG